MLTRLFAVFVALLSLVQSEMEKMKKTQHVQAVYIRKMQALPGKVRGHSKTNR